MSLSIELDPILESQITQEARRLGMTEAEFVKDTLERVLGLKNPSDLLDQICSYTPMGDPHASENTGTRAAAQKRTPPQATPDMLAQRKEALEGLRALGGLRDFIPDPAAWQRELREDRTLPGRD